jgi:hypothetical protein
LVFAPGVVRLKRGLEELPLEEVTQLGYWRILHCAVLGKQHCVFERRTFSIHKVKELIG